MLHGPQRDSVKGAPAQGLAPRAIFLELGKMARKRIDISHRTDEAVFPVTDHVGDSTAEIGGQRDTPVTHRLKQRHWKPFVLRGQQETIVF
jgi:hypothetical protein